MSGSVICPLELFHRRHFARMPTELARYDACHSMRMKVIEIMKMNSPFDLLVYYEYGDLLVVWIWCDARHNTTKRSLGAENFTLLAALVLFLIDVVPKRSKNCRT